MSPRTPGNENEAVSVLKPDADDYGNGCDDQSSIMQPHEFRAQFTKCSAKGTCIRRGDVCIDDGDDGTKQVYTCCQGTTLNDKAIKKAMSDGSLTLPDASNQKSLLTKTCPEGDSDKNCWLLSNNQQQIPGYMSNNHHSFLYMNGIDPNVLGDYRCSVDPYQSTKHQYGGSSEGAAETISIKINKDVEMTIVSNAPEKPDLVVTSTGGNTYIGSWTKLKEGAEQFSDRGYRFYNIPPTLLGRWYYKGPCHSTVLNLQVKKFLLKLIY